MIAHEVLTIADEEIMMFVPQIYYDVTAERLISDIEKLRVFNFQFEL
jgi:hypothetical protein